MMISPDTYRKEFESASLKKLQRERAELIRFMKKYESHALPEDDYYIDPSPEVRYSCYKDYLFVLFELIEEKINNDPI